MKWKTTLLPTVQKTEIENGILCKNTNPTIRIVANPNELVPFIRPSHHSSSRFHLSSSLFWISDRRIQDRNTMVKWDLGLKIFAHSIRHLSLSLTQTHSLSLSLIRHLQLLSLFYEPFSFAYIILLSYGVSTGWAGHRFHFLTHFSSLLRSLQLARFTSLSASFSLAVFTGPTERVDYSSNRVWTRVMIWLNSWKRQEAMLRFSYQIYCELVPGCPPRYCLLPVSLFRFSIACRCHMT